MYPRTHRTFRVLRQLVDRAVLTNFIGLFLILVSVSEADAQRSGAPFEVGQSFPDLILPLAEDGQARAISDYRGQKLILHIFASW